MLGTKQKTITVAQAAELVGVTRLSIYRAIWRGELPHIRIGRAIRLDPEDVLRKRQGRSTGAAGSADVT